MPKARHLLLALVGLAAFTWWKQAAQQPETDAETARRLKVAA